MNIKEGFDKLRSLGAYSGFDANKYVAEVRGCNHTENIKLEAIKCAYRSQPLSTKPLLLCQTAKDIGITFGQATRITDLPNPPHVDSEGEVQFDEGWLKAVRGLI